MERVMRASALVLGLIIFTPAGAGSTVKGQQIVEPPSPQLLTPPCYEPRPFPEADVERVAYGEMYGMTGLSFAMPKTFERDSKARYIEGGIRWRDHERTFEMINGMWGESSFGRGSASVPVYLDCVDSLAGMPFRLIVTWDRSSHYTAIAVPIQVDGVRVTASGQKVPIRRYSSALIGRSRSRENLKLFLTIFRSLRRINR
jgi:hypothetical protein